MTVAFPEIRVGDPVRCNGLAVFPLFAGRAGEAEYVLADEAIEGGKVSVEEVRIVR